LTSIISQIAAWWCDRIKERPAMTDADNLRNQIEGAKRFAASMTSETERIRFETIASALRRELQLVEARQSSLEM
jgi:hypothetical protein